jgi:hypothetical protein
MGMVYVEFVFRCLNAIRTAMASGFPRLVCAMRMVCVESAFECLNVICTTIAL